MAAVGLEGEELAKGAVEAPVSAGFVAIQQTETAGPISQALKGQGRSDLRILVAVLFQPLEFGGQQAGFDSPGAALAPGGGDDLLEQGLFELALGLEAVVIGGGELGKLFAGFTGQDQRRGSEAVTECGA